MNEWTDYLEQLWQFYFPEMTIAIFLVLMLFQNLATCHQEIESIATRLEPGWDSVTALNKIQWKPGFLLQC